MPDPELVLFLGGELDLATGPVRRQGRDLTLQDRDRYPGLLAAAQSPSPVEEDEEWQFGLRCILAGLADLVATRLR